jgi:hypothetical protein
VTNETSPNRIAPSEASGVRRQAGDVPSLRDGAEAPFSASEERGSAKAAAVIAYVEAATNAGLPVDRVARGMVARDTGRLLDDGWELPAILRAIDRFARRRRMAGHLAEWVRENAMDERESEHHDRNEAERASAPRTMRSLGDAMRAAGL